MKLYDKEKLNMESLLFNGQALRALMIPLVIEQVLSSFMGAVDTMMVSRVGEAAISAVSNVDQLNILVIQVFSALATGAVIICSQYLGKNDKKDAERAAAQVVTTVLAISLALTLICLFFERNLLNFLYGKVASDVMSNSRTYFFITALSFPFLALFSAGAAFLRAGGDSKFPMKVSVISNLMNVAGNAVLIFGFGMGVKGAAISTLVSRIFCMIVTFIYLRGSERVVPFREFSLMKPDFKTIALILSVGIPAGIENGMFQFGKLAIQSSVATLTKPEMAAQALAITLEALTGMIGIGIGIGMMTVVGQSIGAGRSEEAKYYIVKLTKAAWIGVAASSFLIMAVTPLIASLADLSDTSRSLLISMMIFITIVKPLVWTPAFVPSYGLRAAGDIKFSMISSMIIMWTIRVALCIFLIRVVGMGPIAVWIAMGLDWFTRGTVYFIRFRSNKWYGKGLV